MSTTLFRVPLWRAKRCKIPPLDGGLSPVGIVVAKGNSSGNWKQIAGAEQHLLLLGSKCVGAVDTALGYVWVLEGVMP